MSTENLSKPRNWIVESNRFEEYLEGTTFEEYHRFTDQTVSYEEFNENREEYLTSFYEENLPETSSLQDFLDNPDNVIAEEDVDVVEGIDYNFQSTLDNWRVYGIVDERLEEVDQRLEEEYGGGIDFAAIYGSTNHGLAIFPDAVLSRAHKKGDAWFEESDIDLLVGLQMPENGVEQKTYRQEAAELIHQTTNDEEYSQAKIHPLVENSSFLLDTFNQARIDWMAKGGEPRERILLKAQEKTEGVYEVNQAWHNFMRSLMKGTAFSEKYWNEELYKELSKGREIILDDSGRLRDDIDFDLTTESGYFGKKPNKADKLERNHLYGIWECLKRSNNIEVPPEEVLMDVDGAETIDELSISRQRRQGEWPFKDLLYGLIDAELSDYKLSTFFNRRVRDGKGKWFHDLSEKEKEDRINTVRSIVEDNIELINKYIHTSFVEDKKYSSLREVENKDINDFEADYASLLNLVGRTSRQDIPVELDMGAEFAKIKIKAKYNRLSDIVDIENPMHESTLGELNSIEDRVKGVQHTIDNNPISLIDDLLSEEDRRSTETVGHELEQKELTSF